MSENIDNTANAGEKAGETSEYQAPATQEELDRIVQKRLDRERRKHEEELSELDELRAKASRLAELEEAGQTELEKAIARAEKAERAAAEAAELVAKKDREVLISRVAAEKKVPAKYLSGDTEEELIAAADEFLADIQSITPDRKPGHVPSTGTGDPKPEVSSLDTGRARAQALLQTNS